MTIQPKMRMLNYRSVEHEGQPMWLLEDPLKLTEQQLLLPPALALIVNYCDGTHTIFDIHQALCIEVGFDIPYDTVAHAIGQLDNAYLLDNERSAAAVEAARKQYREAPYRKPVLAGWSYAATPAGLTNELISYGAGDDLSEWQPWRGCGIISPHIDYMRGGPVYAKVWERTQGAFDEIDLVLMFGTDHKGGLGSITLTQQHYGTPFGPLPTDLALVDQLATAIGPDNAYNLELNHKDEHAIELSAVWLHHIQPEPPPMLPILCGSFHHFITQGGHPDDDPLIQSFLSTLIEATKGRRVMAVASVDFAHVGPAFDDTYRMDSARRDALRLQDVSLIEAICAGDATRFYNEIAAIEDSNRVCGFSSIYLMLRYLGAVTGQQVAYDQCDADDDGSSLVSIAGILLNR